MWVVEFESLAVQYEVEKLVREKKLSVEDQAIIHAWIKQISHHGPESIRHDFKWADHDLTGEWKGYRSSSYSHRGRIIYLVVEEKIVIKIARVTDIHNYRREKKNEKNKKKST